MDAMFDWQKVDEAVNTKRTQYDFETHQHLFKKVAFDRYKSVTGGSQFWELRKGEDGKEYLFALYGEGEDLVTQSTQTKTWEAVADNDGENITLAYKKTPVFRFTSAQYNFEPQDAPEFASFIEEKAQNQDWVNDLISKAMTEERRAAVLKLIQGV